MRGRELAGLAAVMLPLAVGAAEPPPGDPAATAQGRRIYRQRCYVCHLSEGGRGPNLFASTLGDDAFAETVINGRKGASMPAFGLLLSTDDVAQVVAYIRSTGRYE